MRRENMAAALRYLQDKADLRGRFQRATSLDPQEQDMADIAVETAASFVPGVGQALAARDVERARRADDPAGMAMATMGAIPGGRLAGLLKRYDPVMQQLDVYHGTPHKFPATEANPLGEFDASKIGTGEGAQAYGHGVYLAESPGVASHYKPTMQTFKGGEKNRFSIDGQIVEMPLDDANAQNAMINLARGDRRTAERMLEVWKDSAEVKRNMGLSTSLYDNDIDLLTRALKAKKVDIESGSLYKADLPDEMIDRMLDWDKPLSEQRELATPILKELGYLRPNDNGPRQFAEAVKALSLEHGGFGESGATGMGLFNAIYKGLQQGKPKAINLAKRMNLTEQEMFMEASPLASEVMKRMGIPGIKYADAGSRGQGGSGTRNFVVFPGEEKKVRILERK